MRDLRPAAVRLLVALCAAGLVLAACGRKTAVRPPELVAPATIDTLTASNVAEGIRLAWRRPATYVDGTRMNDLGAFRIERSSGGSPFSRIATVAVTDQERFQREHRFRWLDSDTSVGQTFQYRVISSTTDEYVSAPSNIVTIERQIPTPAPTSAATPVPSFR
jgi:hypothetical protein